MSNNIFNKSIKEIIPAIAEAIFDEIKYPRVGTRKIRVTGFTRDILERIYEQLDAKLEGMNREAYKICFIAERAGKTVPITPVEKVLEYRTRPQLQALVVFDPWKIEEYGRNLFLTYSFRTFPMDAFLREYAERRFSEAPPSVRNLFFQMRSAFDGNFPAREKPLREALFAHKTAEAGHTLTAFGENLVFFNAFPDSGLTESNAGRHIKANARLSRLFIHSRLPMNERVLLLCPRDKEAAAMLLEFFAGKDGVLPEFWLLDILNNRPHLFFDKWCSSHSAPPRRYFTANFEGIGRDRRASREVTATLETPYGPVPYGRAMFRVWRGDVVVAERVARNTRVARFIMDLGDLDPGVYQIQVALVSSDGEEFAESWSAPFWWPGIIVTGEELQRSETRKITWLRGPVVTSQAEALYLHMRSDPALKRKKPEFLEASPRVDPIPFPTGDGVQELILQDHMRFFIRVPEVFRTLEKAPLEDIKGLRRYVLDLSKDEPALEAVELNLTHPSEEFLKHRRLLLMQMKRAGSSPSSVNLEPFTSLCTGYLNSYLAQLDAVLRSRAKVVRDELLFTDTVTITEGDRVLGLVTLPTHPLEIAFRLGFQNLLTDAWQEIFRSKREELSPFPPDEAEARASFLRVLSAQEGGRFVLAEVLHPGFTLYVADGVPVSELKAAWKRWGGPVGGRLFRTAAARLSDALKAAAAGRSLSVAVWGVNDTPSVLALARTLAEALPDPGVVFDLSFYATPEGVVDRAAREMERIKRHFCLFDISSDPHAWHLRFPYDRFRLRAAGEDAIENHHVALVFPDFRTRTESFESRSMCRIVLLDGLKPLHLPLGTEHGDVQWSGAGPRKQSSGTDSLADVVENVRDFFCAVSSKIALQKTAAYSHLSVSAEPAGGPLSLLKNVLANTETVLLFAPVGAERMLASLVPPGYAVGSPCASLAAAVNTLKTPAAISLARELGRLKLPASALKAELKKLSPVPLTLYAASDGLRLFHQILARKTLAKLGQTRDGILLAPAHYPRFFAGEGPWPELVLFKFAEDRLIALAIEPVTVQDAAKPEEVKLPDEFLARLSACADSLHGLFERMRREPDGKFSWAEFASILASELKQQVFKGEMVDKDATALSAMMNELLQAGVTLSREDVLEFPFVLLPKASGQIAERPFPNVHPLCRMLSGDEIRQWTKRK